VALVNAIRDELAQADAGGADEYRANAKRYVEGLHKLKKDGRAMLEGKNCHIITQHDSLRYFAPCFKVTVAGVIQETPGTDASGQEIKRLVQLVKERTNGNPAGWLIAVEPQYPPGHAAALQGALKARGLSLPLVKVDPLETADAEELKRLGAGWYEAKMRKNLEALARELP